jgi:apolipoprotein N-acyltransferase
VRSEAPSLVECVVALAAAVLLIISFPDFDLWPLAWIALVPLILLVARRPQPLRSFFCGWLFGTIFFYGSCYWLTYSMIHTGGLSPWVAYPLLFPGAVVMGLCPAVFALLLARAVRRWGAPALFLAPLFWPALDWVRLETTGQLWNAIGYSQAFHPAFIQTARYGGVYVVGALIVLPNAAVAFALLQRTKRALAISGLVILSLAGTLFLTGGDSRFEVTPSIGDNDPVVVAVQPNVPMDLIKSVEDMRQLAARHFEMSEAALRQLPDDAQSGTRRPRLVIWPESPMNFAYGSDSALRERLAAFTKANHTSLLLNSQEIAPNDGRFNSAVLINEQGELVAQYDKIRLLPFGEYVPLPGWFPGAGLIRGMVGEFTPGTNYSRMQVGPVRAGVFICIESAYPSIASRYANEGADVLINISNDGYLGRTAVMRQHLSNAVFRAVENGRPVLRVTNTGITALITPWGRVEGATEAFKPETRIWSIRSMGSAPPAFYARNGDLFVYGCVLLSLVIFVLTFVRTREQRGF